MFICTDKFEDTQRYSSAQIDSENISGFNFFLTLQRIFPADSCAEQAAAMCPICEDDDDDDVEITYFYGNLTVSSNLLS